MVIGFTGTATGMSSAQRRIVRTLFEGLKPAELHHGDCVGSDADAHFIARELDIPIYIHPPTNPRARAFCEGYVSICVPFPYLERNKDIATVCSVLIATPKEMGEVTRSGTWATVRYARKLGRRIVIVLRDGDTIIERGARQFL